MSQLAEIQRFYLEEYEEMLTGGDDGDDDDFED